MVIHSSFHFSPEVLQLAGRAMEMAAGQFRAIEETAAVNQ